MNPYDPSPSDSQQTTASSQPSFSFSNLSDHPECETRARRKLLEWGFDPNDISKSSSRWHASPLRRFSNIDYCSRDSRPMIIFAHLGDLAMLRFLLMKSNDPAGELSRTDECGLFPLYAAISKGHTEDQILGVCEWLVSNGADIHQTLGGEWTPLSRACLFGYGKVALWLLSRGALLDANGSFDAELAKRDLPSCAYDMETQIRADPVHRKIFAWAKETISVQNKYFLFLSGALYHPRTNVDPRRIVEDRLCRCGFYSVEATSLLLKDISEARLRAFLDMTVSPLLVFNGIPGIMERIGHYVGVETNRELLCTAQGLVKHEEWWNLRELVLPLRP